MRKRNGLDAIGYLHDVAGSSGGSQVLESAEAQARRVRSEIRRKQEEIGELNELLRRLDPDSDASEGFLSRTIRRLGGKSNEAAALD